MPIFRHAPGILRDGEKGPAEISQVRVCYNRKELRRRLKPFNCPSIIVPGKFPYRAFVRFLAKIAHGIAIAEVGFGAAPLLLEIVEGDVSQAGWLIGNTVDDLGKASKPNMHLYGTRIATDGEFSLLVVTLNLFAGLLAPSYSIVAAAFDNKYPPNLPPWPEMKGRQP
jgi:hypothetical protein